MELLKKIVSPIQRRFLNLLQPKEGAPKCKPTRFTQLLELEAIRKRNALREQQLNRQDLNQ